MLSFLKRKLEATREAAAPIEPPAVPRLSCRDNVIFGD
jgi:hypothetical protein